MTEEEMRRENTKRFLILCDKVLQFITKEENKTACFSSKQISEMFETDCNTVNAIANKFKEQGLIQLAKGAGGQTPFRVSCQPHSAQPVKCRPMSNVQPPLPLLLSTRPPAVAAVAAAYDLK